MARQRYTPKGRYQIRSVHDSYVFESFNDVYCAFIRIDTYEEEEKQNGDYKENFYEVFDSIEKEIIERVEL